MIYLQGWFSWNWSKGGGVSTAAANHHSVRNVALSEVTLFICWHRQRWLVISAEQTGNQGLPVLLYTQTRHFALPGCHSQQHESETHQQRNPKMIWQNKMKKVRHTSSSPKTYVTSQDSRRITPISCNGIVMSVLLLWCKVRKCAVKKSRGVPHSHGLNNLSHNPHVCA